MAPITQADLAKGYVTTRWGYFKIWPGEENRIHVLSDSSLKQPPPEALRKEPNTGVPVGNVTVDRTEDSTTFTQEEGSLEISNKKIEVVLSGKLIGEMGD